MQNCVTQYLTYYVLYVKKHITLNFESKSIEATYMSNLVPRVSLLPAKSMEDERPRERSCLYELFINRQSHLSNILTIKFLSTKE